MGAFDNGFDEGFLINGVGAAGSRARRRKGRVSTGLFTGLVRRQFVGGGGAPLWTPEALGNLGLWLDAQDVSTIVETAGRVSEWIDKSGNNNDAIQTVASQRPEYAGVGVGAGVEFVNAIAEPNLEHLVLTSDIPGREVFAVVSDVGIGFRADTVQDQFPNPLIGGDEVVLNDYQHIFLSGDTTGGGTYSVSLDGGSTPTRGDAAINGYPYVPGDGTGANIDVDPPSGYTPWPNTTSPDIVTTKWETETPGSVLFRWIGAILSQSGVTPVPNFYSNMRIRELIVIPNKFNTQAERDRMNGYLAWKWGIVDKLPPGHPYKLSPPTTEIWTPADISGLYAFYDASDASTITETAGTVTQVLDKSGNDNHLIQPVGSEQPTYNAVNKRIEFGIDKALYCPDSDSSPWPAGNTDCALMAGGFSGGTGQEFTRIGGVFSDPAAPALDALAATCGLSGDDNFTARHFGGNASDPASDCSAPFVGSINYTTNIGSTTMRFNGAASSPVYASPSSSLAFTTSAHIGWAEYNLINTLQPLNGEFLLLAARNLTQNEQEKIEGWWAHRFNHVDKLPSTHPYKYSPPFRVLWTPIQLPDLAMWLDASRPDTINEVGGKVTQWDDLSYNGRHVSEATGAKQPIYNAELKRIEYDAVDDKLRYIGSVVTQPFSCFTGDEIADIGLFAPLFDGYANGVTDERVSLDGFGGNDRYRVTAGLNSCVSTNAPPNSPEGYYAEFNGASSALYINGNTIPEMTGDAGAQSLTNGVTLSNRSNDTLLAAPGLAKTHILVFCDALLSSSDKAKIEGYWAHTFGYTSLLPVDHPYKTAPPYI